MVNFSVYVIWNDIDAITIPKGRRINFKLNFDIFYNPDGTFKKFKACLVARGDQLQQLDPYNKIMLLQLKVKYFESY